VAKWPSSPLQAKPKGEMNSEDNQSPLMGYLQAGYSVPASSSHLTDTRTGLRCTPATTYELATAQ